MDWALHFTAAFSFIKQPKLSFRDAIFPVRDVPSPAFASQKQRFGQNLSRARTSDDDGRDRPLQKKTTYPARKGKIMSEERQSNPSKSNQEEIISLFKRIQSSISKGEPPKKNPGSSQGEPVTEALLDVIRRSRKKNEGEAGAMKEEDEEGNFVRRDRPPSNFMKRSPIPSPSGPRAKVIEQNSGKELKGTATKEEKSLAVESMKLVELKELAKARGIKGYSKLKKGQLLELLTSSSSPPPSSSSS